VVPTSSWPMRPAYGVALVVTDSTGRTSPGFAIDIEALTR